MLFAVIVVVSVSLWFAYNQLRRPPNFPPGPPGLFSFFTLKRHPEPFISRAILKLSERFGPLVGLVVLQRRFVTASGYRAVSDILNNPSFAARPNSFDFNTRTYGQRQGVLMTDGKVWKEQRRFTIRHLKDFGLGKSSLEGIILDEIADLIVGLQEAVGKSSDGSILFDDTFTVPVINVLWVIAVGRRFERGDPQMAQLVACMNGFMRTSNGGPNFLTVFPFARHIVPELSGYNKLMQYILPIRNYIEREVAEHRSTRKPSETRDFIDVYLDTVDDENLPKDTTFTERNLMGIIFDIFVAGSETTSHTLGFAFIYMITHPEIQTKIQEEIDRVLHGRLPSLSDRGSLPYTEAAILEVQRLGTVAPVTVPHVAEEDTTCLGYNIPKGTLAFVNIWSVHQDPDTWPEPQRFRPERHLDDQGRLVRSDHILTFGLGKRSCIGETLAKNSIFLFFTTLLQTFRFEPPINANPALQPTSEPILGLTLAPRPCLARLVPRKSI